MLNNVPGELLVCSTERLNHVSGKDKIINKSLYAEHRPGNYPAAIKRPRRVGCPKVEKSLSVLEGFSSPNQLIFNKVFIFPCSHFCH